MLVGVWIFRMLLSIMAECVDGFLKQALPFFSCPVVMARLLSQSWNHGYFVWKWSHAQFTSLPSKQRCVKKARDIGLSDPLVEWGDC